MRKGFYSQRILYILWHVQLTTLKRTKCTIFCEGHEALMMARVAVFSSLMSMAKFPQNTLGERDFFYFFY